MSQPSVDGPVGDPWRAVGHVVSGVALYGVLGWLADRWLGTSFLVAVGIVLGAGLGIYATQASLRAQREAQEEAQGEAQGEAQRRGDRQTDQHDE